jgi:hypothetical protein
MIGQSFLGSRGSFSLYHALREDSQPLFVKSGPVEIKFCLLIKGTATSAYSIIESASSRYFRVAMDPDLHRKKTKA